MRTLLLLAILLAGSRALAEHAIIRDHAFGPVPTVGADVKGRTEPTILLRRTVIMDIEGEDQGLVEFHLMHNTVFLRDVASIERENKVYVSLNKALDVIKVQARSITPDGKVSELSSEDFKRATDDQERGSYLYFVFEGLVPGSVIDYFYVLKERPDLHGDGVGLQMGVPIIAEDVHLINPAEFVYKAKSYHGAPEAIIDSSETEVQHMRWELQDVPALEDEESANMAAATMRVGFKLDRIPARGIKDYSGYLGAAKLYHSAIHQELEPKEQKAIAAIVKQLDLPKNASDADKVRAVEEHVKHQYQVVDLSDAELLRLGDVLKNKVGNNAGITALTCAVLRALGVDYQLVITSDRMRMPFDNTFETYQCLDDIVLFIPSLGQYMSPSIASIRLGYIDSGNMANYGLFIRNYDIGGTLTGVGSVKYIDPLPDSATVNDHTITADLSKGPEKCEIHFENAMTGYYAYLQCLYPLLDEEQRKQVVDEMVNYLVENGEVGDLKVENAESRLYGLAPFVIKGTVSTSKFSASAGDKVLFKIGELIGPQVAMYEDKVRKLPVDDDFNRRFDRSIDVVLPPGWHVENLADLKIDKHLDLDGARQLAFEGNATMESNTLKVRVNEYYRKCQIPLEHFEGYRAVVNAAADYNKLVLVLARD